MSVEFVLDASVTLTWCFRDEATPATQALLLRLLEGQAVVPALYFVELTNTLATAERKGRITTDHVNEFVAELATLRLVVDEQHGILSLASLMPICRMHKLTAYDAVYLDLAMRRRLPLATLDTDLRAAARREAVEVLPA